MTLVLLLARLLLALVFGTAGIAKLLDRPGSRQALLDFGAPSGLASPLALLLPLAELAVALALLPPSLAWWGALGALALLLLFVVGIGVNLAQGRTPDCHCFGQLHSSPVSWRTLARNLALAVVAIWVLAQGQSIANPAAPGWWDAWSGAQRAVVLLGILGGALLLVVSWLLLHVIAQNGRLLLRLEGLELALGDAGLALPGAPGLPVGSKAPSFELPTLDGDSRTLEDLLPRNKPLVLLFIHHQCGPCAALLPEIAAWQRELRLSLSIALIGEGSPGAIRAKLAEYDIRPVLLQHEREVAQAYKLDGTPGAVLIRPDGTVGSPLAAGADAVRALVARSRNAQLPLLAHAAPAASNGNGHAHHAAPAALKLGQPAPSLQLPDLDGQIRDLTEFRGHKTLVLFWNPGCGYCQRMLDDLKRWEAKPPKEAPRLLIVSTGDPDAIRAQGLRSPVVLDPTSQVAGSFGSHGTPMGILIDAEGHVVSELAAGSPAVLRLLGAPQSTQTAST